MYEIHDHAYMWDCPRCTPMCEVHANVTLKGPLPSFGL